MKKSILFLFVLFSLTSMGQKTWYGDVAVFGGGGTNDIFRFRELEGAGSYTGEGYWATGIDFRRIFTDHISLETGLGYTHQSYIMRSAPTPDVTETPGAFGLLAVPVTVRVDFLKYFFVDAGLVAGLQTAGSLGDEMTGLGLTAGVGLQYKFKSDIFISVRALMNQHAMLHIMPESYPHTLWNSGITVSAGYRFIHLGACNCPEDNSPKRKFF